jgi:two-component system chemotaxis response regulator CheY
MAEFEYKNVHVLLVDDEPFMIKLLDRLLKELGVTLVSTAGDGTDGLAKLAKLQASRHPVDIIVCDLEMPNMNGMEFVKRVRSGSDGVPPNLPIVVLTGHAEEETVHQAVGLKISGYVVKPVSRNTLDKRLRSALAPASKA